MDNILGSWLSLSERGDGWRTAGVASPRKLIHSDPGLDRVALQIVPSRSGGHQAIFDSAGSGATGHADDRTDDLVGAWPQVTDRVSACRDCGGDLGAARASDVVSYREARRVTGALYSE